MTAADLSFTGRLVLAGEADFEVLRADRIFNRRLPGRAARGSPGGGDRAGCGQRRAPGRSPRLEGRRSIGRAQLGEWSIRDEALVIDLGRFKEISYDEQTSVVTVTGSVLGGMELDPFLAEHGRFFNGGHCPTVGIGGFILQGGQGWNARGWGWAAERLLAIDVVTADGELVRADAAQHADLLWAARGAGPGFFGVVTRFHLETLPRPALFAHTVQVYPMELFDEVMTWLQGMHGQVDRRVEIVAVAMTPPGDPHHGPVLTVTALAFVDDQSQALAVLAPFEDCPVLHRALSRQYAKPTPLSEHRAEQRRANPEGHRWRADNAWVQGSPEQVIPAIRRAFTDLPNAGSFTIWFSMAPLRELPDMAFSLQSEIYVAAYTLWAEERDDARYLNWVSARMAEMQPVASGQYLGDSDFATRQLKFMADGNWTRLQEIRTARDPEGLFVGYLADGPVTNANHWEAG